MPLSVRALTLSLAGACGLVAAAIAQPAAPAPAVAASAPLPTRAFFELPRYVSAELSPDSRHLAISGSRGGEPLSVFVMDLQAPTLQARQVRASLGDTLSLTWWGNDLLAMGAGQLGTAAGQVRAESAAFTLLLGDQKPRRLESRGWAPLAVVPQLGQAEPHRRVVVGDPTLRDGRPPLWRPQWLNLDSRQPEPMDLGGAPTQVQRWWFDRQGTPRLAWAEEGQSLRLYVRRGQGDQARWVPHPVPPGPALWPLGRPVLPWVPLAVDEQGRVLAQTWQRPVAGAAAPAAASTAAATAAGPSVPPGLALSTARVAWVDPATGALASPALLETPGFMADPELVYDVDSGALVGLRVDTDQPRQVWLDPRHAAAQAAADRRFPGRFNRVQCQQCGTAQAVWLVQTHSDTHPGDLWVYRAAQTQWRQVVVSHPQIDPAQMAPMVFEWLRARDGRPLPVWLTLPKAVEQGRSAPAVVVAHGGPWVRGGRLRWSPMAQFLAARGYLVIEPDFRGSAGYGPEHLQAGFKQWGQAMQDDLADALLWARQQGLANDRACIEGGSYGGYAALMGPVRHPGLYRCVAAGFALTDLPLLVQGHWLVTDDTSEHTRAVTLARRVGHAEKDAALLREHSPVYQAARIDVPVLLASGELDVRVPRAHLERLVQALTAEGRPPRWQRYAHEAHGLRSVDNQTHWADLLAAFLDQHLGGSAAAPAPGPGPGPGPLVAPPAEPTPAR